MRATVSVKVLWNQNASVIEICTSSTPWSYHQVERRLDPVYGLLDGTKRPVGVIVRLADPPYIPTDSISAYRRYLDQRIDEVVATVFVGPESMMLNVLFGIIERMAKHENNYSVARTDNLESAYSIVQGCLNQYQQAV